MNKKINTIYIISKGRPRCTTAKTLETIKYPGEWFIVCGTNDVTLDEYKKNWGEHVLVFDFEKEVAESDFLDNLGIEGIASGAVPVRNATQKLSEARGDERHWQFDDDYTQFRRFSFKEKKFKTMNGRDLEKEMYKIAEFGHTAGLQNVGFQPASSSFPDTALKFSPRVFNAHNLPSKKDQFVTWRGRMNDDTVNALDVLRSGGYEISFNYLQMAAKKTQTESGGNTDLYKDNGTVMKTAYIMLPSPISAILVIKFGRYHHRNVWARISPKLIHEKYAKN